MVCFVIVIAVAILQCTQGSDWSYEGEHGPSHWAATFPICGRSAQSPIDVPDFASTMYDQGLVPFTLNGFQTAATYEIKNNGHSVQMTIDGNVNVVGGKLQNAFNTAQLHFHWGSTSSKGSEHTLMGKAYPMEVHIVNWNTKYGSIAEAVDKPDGLAVLGFWFEVSPSANPSYTTLLNQFTNVVFKDKKANVTNVNLRSLIPTSLDRYYRYHGSLTTPPCFESVTWTMFESRIPISERQLQQFRSLSTEKMPNQHDLVNNFRPVQRLNNRKVYRSFDTSADSSPRILSSLSFMGCFVILSYLISN